MNYFNQNTGFRWANEFPRGGRLAQRVRTGGRRQLLSGDVSKMQCGSQVYVNLFFDGTGNHKESDKKTFEQTNIARLYSASRGSEDPVKTEDGWIFKYYIQGVGTPFEEIGETTFSLMGKAFAKGFGNRIGWAYTRLLNAAYIATPKSEKLPDLLLKDGPAFEVCEELSRLDGCQVLVRDPNKPYMSSVAQDIEQPVLESALMMLGKLYDPDEAENKHEKIRKIWINVFGFSRGAAEARVFVNRLINHWAPGGKLSYYDRNNKRVGAIDYEVNFMGLFDTVASVKGVDSLRSWADLPIFDGHWDWAANGRLNVPTAVNRCVHFIAIHEQRMSFLLDLIRKGQYDYPGYRLEAAYPGVHSDVGGGYRPNDQGKAYSKKEDDESHKLELITLHDMYDEAVVAGVPMRMGKPLIDEVHDSFDIDDDVVDAYNAWRKEMPSVSRAEEAIRLGMAQRLAWQAKRSLPKSSEYITRTPFYMRSREDPLTPYEVKKISERQRNDMKRKRNQLTGIREGIAEVGGSLPDEATQRQLNELDAQIAPLNKELAEDEGFLQAKIAGKSPEDHRTGEDAGDLLTNDKTDLRESAEEFRLLMGYLFPKERESVWDCFCDITGVDTLSVQREAKRDGDPVDVTLTDYTFVFTTGGLAFDWRYFDVLVKPAEEVLDFLREHTNEQARAAVSAAAIRLYDDFVHDSRAGFRVRYFHETVPGGYGWPRVLYQGGDDRVTFLDIPPTLKQQSGPDQSVMQFPHNRGVK